VIDSNPGLLSNLRTAATSERVSGRIGASRRTAKGAHSGSRPTDASFALKAKLSGLRCLTIIDAEVSGPQMNRKEPLFLRSERLAFAPSELVGVRRHERWCLMVSSAAAARLGPEQDSAASVNQFTQCTGRDSSLLEEADDS
jgi:hypothetical protein